MAVTSPLLAVGAGLGRVQRKALRSQENSLQVFITFKTNMGKSS